MGMTITEKILAKASGKNIVAPGEIVFANVDVALCHDVTSDLAKSAATQWYSSMFTAGETTTICKVCLSLKSSTGADVGYDLEVYIYDTTGVQPDPAGTKELMGTLDLAELTGSFAWYCLDSGTASITNTFSVSLKLTSAMFLVGISPGSHFANNLSSLGLISAIVVSPTMIIVALFGRNQVL